MRQTILDQISTALALRQSHFFREQDIQLYLANFFINSALFDEVYIEYHVPRSLLPENLLEATGSVYVDIVLKKDDTYYPIEIKYKTAAQETPHSVFGLDIHVFLGNHGAQNIGCYDFWKDVRRTEFLESTFPSCRRGIVLFVTNDGRYRSAPTNQNVGYAQFSIHQGRNIVAGALLHWNGDRAVGIGRPALAMKYSYELSWQALNYDNQHRYLMV